MLKDIVILANSRMHHCRCLAGKFVSNGRWVRLKSKKAECNGAFPNSQLSELIGKRSGPKILDCYRISLSNKCPLRHQPENVSVNETPWKKTRSLTLKDLETYLDTPTYEWIGDSITLPDRVPEYSGKNIASSLILIKMSYSKNKTIIYYQRHNSVKYRPRLKFYYNNIAYNLPITDDFSYPNYTHHLINDNECYIPSNKTNYIYCKELPEIIVKNAYVTLGLGQKYQNAYFKIVVNIIEY